MEGNHDFDFEFGEWDVEVRVLQEPLSGADVWDHYTGISIVRPVWGGLANLGELKIAGPSGDIQGLSLRLFRPEIEAWDIRWANSRVGELSSPMTGRFDDGIGTFTNTETIDDIEVDVRFLFTEIGDNSFEFEQAFSRDGSETWQANWLTSFSRREG